MSSSDKTPGGDAPPPSATRSIMRSPGSGTIKAVTIDGNVESISPMMRGESKNIDEFQLDRPTKQHRAKIASRLSGRPSTERLAQSRQGSLEFLADLGYESNASTRPNSIHHQDPGFLHRVHTWLHQERNRRANAKARRKAGKGIDHAVKANDGEAGEPSHRRSSNASTDSEGSAALEKLQEILAAMALTDRPSSRKGTTSRRPSSFRKLRRASTAASSDTEYMEGDALVPTCEAILDNSKTLAYSGGGADGDDASGERPAITRTTSTMNKDAWKSFKYEIVRLTHTLRLKGWRKVSMDMSSLIEVERLSGALTNAVYVVSPPKDIPSRGSEKSDGPPQPRKPPPKLLLRIYGTNVDHLIDRESELQILRRLARKRIGPRLLGTFTNGRFEEFLHARALNPQDLHDPSTSKQIAKRFRELHDGIDLLPEERLEDPFVWRNIDKWMPRCSQIVSWVDTEAKRAKGSGDAAKQRPFVCGTEWSKFVEVLEKYRKWLYQQYGGDARVRSQLVFAHNDAQYGNLLRMVPSGESPLMLPANEHKQLVVIDFEYANANLPGLEFANHFTEWCYNYHDEKAPHACNHKAYPNPEEQRRFLKAYVSHKSNFGPSYSRNPSVSGTPSQPQTPALGPAHTSLSTSLISNFMLDSRTPAGSQSVEKADEEAERAVEMEVNRLIQETRLWRLANSAMWVMWGVMQAKIPNLPDFEDPTQSAAIAAGPSETDLEMKGKGKERLASDPLGQEEEEMADDLKDKRPDPEEENEDEGEFDYLGYSWERALLFWGDAVAFGLVALDELPEIVRREIKIVEY